MSTEDGPGLRTTVFFKGCTLACAWCHNPESIPADAQVIRYEQRCIGCGTCVSVCPEGAITDVNLPVNATRCVACGRCVEACPGGALDLLGTEWTLDALVAEVLKDRAFFAKSGGGVTISGGEPSMQARFVEAFMKRLREEDIHVALDTCGMCATGVLLPLIDQASLVLYDLKVMDSLEHERLTKQPNERILLNLRAVAARLRERRTGDGGDGAPGALWIRTPLVPDATATDANLRAIGAFIREALGDLVTRWELCAFNNLCRSQYLRLGLDWAFAKHDLLRAEDLEHFAEIARRASADPRIVFATGATTSTPSAENET